MLVQAARTLLALGLLTGGVQADQDEGLLREGSYEVSFRLELPHLERWAIDRTATLCLPMAETDGLPPLPVLSGNNPLAACPADNVRRDGADLTFDIACAGRDAARARAAYRLTPLGFEGRIRMVMGAKNMTMTEVQAGRRVGSCDLAESR